MNANQQTLFKANVGTPEEIWWIDAVGNCGEVLFPRAIVILEPKSVNPGIAITGTALGLRGMKRAVALIEEERAKLGLTTLE